MRDGVTVRVVTAQQKKRLHARGIIIHAIDIYNNDCGISKAKSYITYALATWNAILI
jgi:hypothetical protein